MSATFEVDDQPIEDVHDPAAQLILGQAKP